MILRQFCDIRGRTFGNSETGMSRPDLTEDARAAILAQPEAVLEDDVLLAALIQADDAARGSNVVDLRGIAMKRLSDRLDRLEDTHRSVIAAAYDTVTGTRQVHRAVLGLMEAESFEAFIANLAGPVRDMLRVDALRLVMESAESGGHTHDLGAIGQVLQIVPSNFVQGYMTVSRDVVLRPLMEGAEALYGVAPGRLSSEACLRLDLGEGRLPAMLVLGSAEGEHFSPQQGTDLLEFFADVLERMLRNWLR